MKKLIRAISKCITFFNRHKQQSISVKNLHNDHIDVEHLGCRKEIFEHIQENFADMKLEYKNEHHICIEAKTDQKYHPLRVIRYFKYDIYLNPLRKAIEEHYLFDSGNLERFKVICTNSKERSIIRKSLKKFAKTECGDIAGYKLVYEESSLESVSPVFRKNGEIIQTWYNSNNSIIKKCEFETQVAHFPNLIYEERFNDKGETVYLWKKNSDRYLELEYDTGNLKTIRTFDEDKNQVSEERWNTNGKLLTC